jgi:hypothetical protein
MVSTGLDGFPARYTGSVRLRSLFRLFNTIRTKPPHKLRRHIVSQALHLLPRPQGNFPLRLPRSSPGSIFEFLVSPPLVECYLSAHQLNAPNLPVNCRLSTPPSLTSHQIPAAPVFSFTYELPIFYFLCFDIHACNWGVYRERKADSSTTVGMTENCGPRAGSESHFLLPQYIR